jgi:hypothetical protein
MDLIMLKDDRQIVDCPRRSTRAGVKGAIMRWSTSLSGQKMWPDQEKVLSNSVAAGKSSGCLSAARSCGS